MECKGCGVEIGEQPFCDEVCQEAYSKLNNKFYRRMPILPLKFLKRCKKIRLIEIMLRKEAIHYSLVDDNTMVKGKLVPVKEGLLMQDQEFMGELSLEIGDRVRRGKKQVKQFANYLKDVEKTIVKMEASKR